MRFDLFLQKKIFLSIVFILLASWGCTPLHKNTLNAPSQTTSIPWVLLGPNNQTIVRINTVATACPMITLDGIDQPMSVRAEAEVIPQRTTANDVRESKPSIFSSMTCEAVLPKNTVSASIAKRELPLPKVQPTRIVILGDTGCRMKKSNGQYFLQDCSNEITWPFAKIARAAAALKPDLVLHVGDYHYREAACPPGNQSCIDSPWGYGEDAWAADLFQPAAPLLTAAPWIVVRGNHEECARAGQGWFRYLDTQPYSVTRTCNDPAYDDLANYSEPYAVALDKHAQIIVFDSAKTIELTSNASKGLSNENLQARQYRRQLQQVANLVSQTNADSFFTSHHPVLGWSSTRDMPIPLAPRSGLAQAMQDFYGKAYFPKEVRGAFHGHIHNLQIISFASDHPATFVVGNGGDSAHHGFPEPFPKNMQPALGTLMQSFAHTKSYGFILMEKLATDWSYRAYDADGRLLISCNMVNARQLSCDKTGKL